MGRIFDEIDISVVTYNSSKWIKQFINSLYNQDYPINRINIYFTDNSSKDSTYEDLIETKNQYEKYFNTLEVYSCRNDGFGAGHNNNICNSKSAFILVTNIDLQFERDAIIKVMDFAQQDDDATASWELRQKPYEHPKLYNGINLETNWSSSACILFRRVAIEKISGYEKRIFMYGEDVEISYRLRDYGYKLKYYPKAVCWHYTYEDENTVKPLQFLGSTLGNIYLRMRYGTFFDIIKGCMMYLMLIFSPEQFSGQRKGVIKNLIKIVFNSPYFLLSRKKSDIQFQFIGWDYEIQRDGAFYDYEKFPVTGKKLISVIIRTYGNRIHYLHEAVQSVINQTYPRIELVVVEDGSQNAKLLIESIQEPNIVSVKYVSIPKSGRCVGGNAGMKAASGEYFAFLDDDDWFFSEHLEVVMASIEKYGVVAAYANGFECKTSIISTEPLKYEEMEYNIFYCQEFSRILMWHNNYIPIQTIVFSRKLYDEYGGFDLELENLEDWNLWTRYSLKNDFQYIAKTTSVYRVPAENSISLLRQDVLDSYYNKAVDKQRLLQLENYNVAEVMAMYKELNNQLIMFQISKDSLRNTIRKYKVLNGSYYLMRKLYYKIIKKQ